MIRCPNCARAYSSLVSVCPECRIPLNHQGQPSPQWGLLQPQPPVQPQLQPQPQLCRESEFEIQNNVLVKYNGTATRVAVPEGVVNVGKEAFANNPSIQYVTLPNSLYGLGKDCFLNCTNLREVNIPGNVQVVRFDWFAGCTNLDRLVIQHGVKTLHFGIKLGQFCAKQIEIPDTLTDLRMFTINGEDHMQERIRHPKQIIASDWWFQSFWGFFREMPDFVQCVRCVL